MTRVAFIAAMLGVALLGVSAGDAAESSGAQLAQRGRNVDDGMPKGPYRDTCQCQISGGIYLQCFCANLNARMFQTNMDIRTCPAPKEIKNCDGTLRCKEKTDEC